MIFVSSEFELTKDKIAVLTAFYPESVITNTSTVPVTLYKSKDGTTWSVLTTLNPNQQTVITLDSGYPYITIKDNGTAYVNSKTPNYYHDSTGNNTGVTAEQLNQVLNDTVVKTIPQSLTDTQMTQARDNINAVSETQLAVSNQEIVQLKQRIVELSTLPATTHTRLLPSQYLNLVGKKDLGDGTLLPVYEVATTLYGVSSTEHEYTTYKLLEESSLDIKVNLYKQEGTGTLMPGGLSVSNSLDNAVEVSVRLVGANELAISLVHTGEYLSTQAGNTPVRGHINIFGEQLAEYINIQYDLVNRNALLESLRAYFTVESGTDYFNIIFDNWDLGGSQLPDGIDYINIELHGIQFTNNATMFGGSTMSTYFYNLTSNELANTSPVDNDAYTGKLTGITVSWEYASIHIPATNR